jgi:Ca-activated chloride channel family protein
MRFVTLVFVLVSLLPAQAAAGKLYAREKGRASPIYNLLQTGVATTVRIDDRLATTHVDERFLNDTPHELEGFYVFELPDGAVVDGLWMWVDGTRQTFTVRRKEEAEQVYDSLREAGIGDPAILSTLGANRFQLRLYPLRPGVERRIEIEYFQLLPVARDGRIRYAYPMNMSGYQSAPVAQLRVTVTLRSQAEITSLQTNFDGSPAAVDRTVHGPTHREITLGAEDILVEDDFVLTWTLDGWSDRLFVLTHTDTAAADSSVFLTWFPDTVDNGGEMAADVVFAIDASGSMTGLRAEVTKDAVTRVLPLLSPRDRVHILLFNGECEHFPSDSGMSFLTPESAFACRTFLDEQYRPRGITDFSVAFEALHTLALRPEALLRCILVTDGLANRGDLQTAELLGHLIQQQRSVVLTPVAVYSDRIDVLSDLADITGSQLCALQQGKDIDDALGRVTHTFDAHAVSDISLSFPIGTSDVVPGITSVGNLEQSWAAGRFTPPVEGDAVLRYRLFGIAEGREVRRPVSLRGDSSSPVQIARWWASRQIDQLCARLIDLEDSTEVREQVIALSEKYNVLSPFTAFIVYHEVDGGGTTVAATLPGSETLRLAQNYPNPFNPTTTITFTVPAERSGEGIVRIRIYDGNGRLVRVLTERRYAPGTYSVTWDGTGDAVNILPSGNYYCVLTWGSQRRVITMSLIK